MTSAPQPAPKDAHVPCADCDLAVYCFCDPSTWVFRTTAELEEKLRRIQECPTRRDDVTAPR